MYGNVYPRGQSQFSLVEHVLIFLATIVKMPDNIVVGVH